MKGSMPKLNGKNADPKDINMELMWMDDATRKVLAEVEKTLGDNSEITVRKIGNRITFSSGDGAVELELSEAGGAFVSLKEDEVVVITCTDERPVLSLKKDGQNDSESRNYLRLPGAVAGLAHAFEVTDHESFVEALRKVGIEAANHSDDHHHSDDESRAGCGYLGLCKMEQAEAVFGVEQIDSVTEVVEFYESKGVKYHVELEGDHTGAGFIISLLPDASLTPTSPQAKSSFFSLDLGVLVERISKTEFLDAIELSDKNLKDGIVQTIYANMAAVFILSDGTISNFEVLESQEDDWNDELMGYVEDAHKQFKNNVLALGKMLAARRAA